MPMVWRGESHHVDIFVFQQLSNIGVALDLLARSFALFHFSTENFLIHVAKSHQSGALYFRQFLEMFFAASVETDDGVADVTIGPNNLGRSRSLCRDFSSFLGSESREQT